MTLTDYQKEARRTLPDLGTTGNNVIHMLFGLQTEVGELTDIYKRELAYKKEADLLHVQEELGDIMWYWINLCSVLGINPVATLEKNINKLRTRFPEKFTESQALIRDLKAERKSLED